MNRLRSVARREGGYTMIELLTVMLIMGVVMAGLTTMFVQASNAELDMNNRFSAQTEARLALDRMRREAHTACAASLTPNSTSAWAATFTFRGATTNLNGAQATSGSTLTVSSTYGFPTAGSLAVNGITLAYTGTTATTFTGVSGGTATVQATGTPVALASSLTCSASANLVTWCTRSVSSSTTRFALYRVQSATCGASGGTRYADYLTPSSSAPTCGTPTALCAFSLTAQSTSTLAKLHTDFPINLKPRKGVEAYELTDDLVLRNSCRVSGGCTT